MRHLNTLVINSRRVEPTTWTNNDRAMGSHFWMRKKSSQGRLSHIPHRPETHWRRSDLLLFLLGPVLGPRGSVRPEENNLWQARTILHMRSTSHVQCLTNVSRRVSSLSSAQERLMRPPE